MNQISERVKAIIRSNIIVDTLSHGPILWTEPFIEIADKMIKTDVNPFKIVQFLIAEFSKIVVTDDNYFSKLKNAWKKSGVNCVSWTLGPIHEKPYSLDGVRHNLAYMTYMLENRRDAFLKILKVEDMRIAKQEGKIGIILNLQDLGFIGTNLELLEYFYLMGFRVMQLTYNSKNTIGTGCTARRDKGLTEFGINVIEKVNKLKAIIDVSHCGPQTSMDAALASKSPIIASHTIAEKVFKHDRAKSDEILKAIAEKGGYIGVLTVPGFLTSDSKATISNWLDHIDYIINLVGIDHVGIGTDYYGYSLPDNLAAKIGEFIDMLGFRPEHKANFLDKMVDFENYDMFPNLISGLISRGYSDVEIGRIAGDNFIQVFKKICY
ncbi:MAG: dipeptidase [Candidatus Hermodarchaeota archaeon]